jgi:hypothetical protein
LRLIQYLTDLYVLSFWNQLGNLTRQERRFMHVCRYCADGPLTCYLN